MTILEAFKQLTDSEEFKTIARQRDAEGSKYRVYLKRFNDDELKAGAMVELLIANGYTISADKTVKKSKRKTN